MKHKLVTILVIVLSLGCSTTSTSIVIADRYDQYKNVTTLTILPYGNIDIPGQWTKTNYNEVSKQYFFQDNDSTLIAVTKNPQEKYPFYTVALTENEFAREFFEWEKNYYEKQGYEIREKTSGENYVIWTAKGKDVNTIFIYGAKKGIAYNFGVFTDNWTEKEKIDFLTGLFERN